MIRITILLVLLAQTTVAQKLKKKDKVVFTNLQKHISFLADDKLEGRRTGTNGEKLAYEYISSEFTKAGLTAKGENNTYLQAFEVNEGKEVNKPTHLLGIGEPDDLFVGVENGADTFDCVAASRVARNNAVYGLDGRFNISVSAFKRDFSPIDESCGCYTCRNYTKAYLNHLIKGKEMLSATLLTIHNEYFIVNLVAKMRQCIIDGNFFEFKEEFLGRFYASRESN